MICASNSGTLSAKRYTVSFNDVVSADIYRSPAQQQ
jgi:hypothetical protein